VRFRSRLPAGQECPVCGRSGATPVELADDRATARDTLTAKIDAMEARLAEVGELVLPVKAS
jgi:hypothetical protein